MRIHDAISVQSLYFLHIISLAGKANMKETQVYLLVGKPAADHGLDDQVTR
jgi:hypothetical protein